MEKETFDLEELIKHVKKTIWPWFHPYLAGVYLIPGVYDPDGSTNRYLLRIIISNKTRYFTQNEIGETFYEIPRRHAREISKNGRVLK